MVSAWGDLWSDDISCITMRFVWESNSADATLWGRILVIQSGTYLEMKPIIMAVANSFGNMLQRSLSTRSKHRRKPKRLEDETGQREAEKQQKSANQCPMLQNINLTEVPSNRGTFHGGAGSGFASLEARLPKRSGLCWH